MKDLSLHFYKTKVEQALQSVTLNETPNRSMERRKMNINKHDLMVMKDFAQKQKEGVDGLNDSELKNY